MKKARIIKVAAHPIFITAFIAVFSLPFLPGFFPRYQAKITESILTHKEGSYITWADINNDGESEQFIWFTNTEGKAE